MKIFDGAMSTQAFTQDGGTVVNNSLGQHGIVHQRGGVGYCS